MATLRQELARLHGLPTFAHYALRRTMARSPEAVNRFLAGVKAAVEGVESDELEELRAEKSRDLATPLAATRIERWDIAYYEEKVRRARFPVDAEALRGYFPTGDSVEYMLRVSQALFGVKFTEVKVAAWHPDVRYFDVRDARSGAFVAGFYLDLFPREGKPAGAAAFPIRGASRLAHRTPLAALVASVNREGLEPDELETLMHEFAHVLHAVLSTVDYNLHAGTSVRRDFIEAPARVLEAWARQPQALELLAAICAACPRLSAQDSARLEGARRYGQGIRYARQWLYASFDLALATEPQPPLELWKKLESATALGYVAQTSLPSSFSHIADNAAGYYAYLWSEVIALDLLSAFTGHMLDPAVGMRFRDAILAQGGQEDEMVLVRQFLGREPSAAAFRAGIATAP
jgi:thimet oligopeptidase